MTGEQLRSWSELTEAVDVPIEIGMAITTARSELLTLAKREFDYEEQQQIINLLRVLLDTNAALQNHSVEVHKQMEGLRNTCKGLMGTVQRLSDFARFSEVVEGPDDF